MTVAEWVDKTNRLVDCCGIPRGRAAWISLRLDDAGRRHACREAARAERLRLHVVRQQVEAFSGLELSG